MQQLISILAHHKWNCNCLNFDIIEQKYNYIAQIKIFTTNLYFYKNVGKYRSIYYP